MRKKATTRDSKLRGFGQWITSFSWQHLFFTEPCTEKFAIFKDTMQDALDRYLPKRSFRLHSTDKPWITPKIKSWIAKRQRFLAKLGKNSSLFRLWRNKVSSAIATCKRSFYVAKVKNLKNTNTSRWWREIKNLSGISGNSGQWYRQLIDGQIIDSVDKLCMKINEFFAGLTSSFTPLDPSDISNIMTSLYKMFLKIYWLPHTRHMRPCTLCEYAKQLDQMIFPILY